MRTFIILSLAIAATLAAPALNEEVDPFIVGGLNALPGEFPFIVSIQWERLGISSHVCGGTIISPIWILTTAHCITEISTVGRITVQAGKHNLAVVEESEVISEIDRGRTIIHPDWSSGGQAGPDDLALVRLQVPLVFTDRIRPVRLPQAHAMPVGPATVSGFGSTGSIIGTNTILQKTTKPIISNDVCREAISAMGSNGNLVDDTNFCTGPLTGGVSVCSGDFGSPIVQGTSPNQVLVGIASWGITPCGVVGAPSGVYKRASAYNNWIFANTGVSE